MESIFSVIEWMAAHGFRLTHRQRDAIDAAAYLYVFKPKSGPRIGVWVVDGELSDDQWRAIASEVLTRGKQDQNDNDDSPPAETDEADD